MLKYVDTVCLQMSIKKDNFLKIRLQLLKMYPRVKERVANEKIENFKARAES